MNLWQPARRVRHWRRYREIVSILAKHGYWALIEQLGLQPLVTWPMRLRRREPPPPQSLSQRIRTAIEELGPTFIKLGQALSVRPDLVPPEFLVELARLQDQVPPAPWPEVEAVLTEAYGGPWQRVFAHIDPTPLGSASLGQAHAATLHDGTEVVVKVQRPGIRRVIEVDLEILHDLASIAQQRTALGEIYNLVEVVEEFAFTLRNELNYVQEGRNADRLRENMASLKTVYVPRVYWEYTSERVLVLERVHGVKIDDVEGLLAAGLDPKQVILNAADMVVKQALIDGFFHADPHPGNIFVMEGNVLGLMDFGIVGYLSERVREDLIRLFIVSVLMDSEGIVEQLIRMSVVRAGIDRVRLRRDIERVLTRYYGLPLKYIRAREVITDLLPIMYRHHISLPPDLWLLGKTLMMWEGLAFKLYPDFDFFAVADPYVRRFLREARAPRALARQAARVLNRWGGLLVEMPEHVRPLLMQLEQGQVQWRSQQVLDRRYLALMDRLASRVALSVLLAAFILGLGSLLPQLNLRWPWSLTTWLVVAGFIGAVLLSLWLLWNMVRGYR